MENKTEWTKRRKTDIIITSFIMFTTEENDAIADTYLNKYIIGRSGMCTLLFK
jgi:hypothetical protein